MTGGAAGLLLAAAAGARGAGARGPRSMRFEQRNNRGVAFAARPLHRAERALPAA
jgi:hypothetical protein